MLSIHYNGILYIYILLVQHYRIDNAEERIDTFPHFTMVTRLYLIVCNKV